MGGSVDKDWSKEMHIVEKKQFWAYIHRSGALAIKRLFDRQDFVHAKYEHKIGGSLIKKLYEPRWFEGRESARRAIENNTWYDIGNEGSHAVEEVPTKGPKIKLFKKK